MPDFVDLRSDTVTRPTAAMRKAMYEAEVGDDAYGEDPTVARSKSGTQRGWESPPPCYVPSGVMANQLAIRVLAKRRALVIAGRRQHVVAYEDGAAAENSGVQFHTLPDEDGTISPAGIRWAIEACKPPHARTLSRMRGEHPHGGVGHALAPRRSRGRSPGGGRPSGLHGRSTPLQRRGSDRGGGSRRSVRAMTVGHVAACRRDCAHRSVPSSRARPT